MTRSPRSIVWLSLAVGFISTSGALAGRYDDFAAWAERDKASSTQLLLDMASAKSAHELAVALKKSASRQHKITSELIEVVHHHPELRCLADLGLEEEAFQRWSRQHPDAAQRRARLPEEALLIAARLHRYTEVAQNEATLVAAKKEVLARYRNDPEVAAAAEQLHVVLQDNERRLMNRF